MALSRTLHGSAFTPEDIRVLTTAYEQALQALRLINRADPTTEFVAKKIIEHAARGERDPIRLRAFVVQALSIEPPRPRPKNQGATRHATAIPTTAAAVR